MFRIVLLISLFYSVNVYGQTIKDCKEKYLGVEFIKVKTLSSKVYMRVYYGQEVKSLDKIKQHYLKDDTGKEIIFNSFVSGLNYLSSKGFKLWGNTGEKWLFIRE